MRVSSLRSNIFPVVMLFYASDLFYMILLLKMAEYAGPDITDHTSGFTSPDALVLAEKCGIAFQLTNILRDVREDCELGRQYLPTEDLERFGLTAAELVAGGRSEKFAALMEFELERAKGYYDESAPLLGMILPESRASLWALITIYSSLRDKIAESPTDVLGGRVSLSKMEKIVIVLRAFTGFL